MDHSEDYSFLQQILIILLEIKIRSFALLGESTIADKNKSVFGQFEDFCYFSGI